MEADAPRKRRSRMHRTGTGRRIELLERDIEIFRLLQRYRYLRSSHLHWFIGGDRTKFIERLGKLYHEGGYLDRPEQQWDALGSRCQPIVYAVSAKAVALLRERGEPEMLPLASFGNGRQFQHALMVCEVLAEIELAAMERGVRLIPWDEIRRKSPQAGSVPQIPVSISCNFSGRTEHADILLTPDAVFGLEYAANGVKSYRFFALEADRGTMPVERNTLSKSSYLRKLLSYRRIISQGLYKTDWGVPNLLVVSALPNLTRLTSVMELLNQISEGRGSGSFLFSVDAHSRGDSKAWQRVGHPELDLYRP